MRVINLTRLLPLAAVAMLPGAAFAQGWIKYVNEAERFIVNFPGEPQAREISYTAESGLMMPARAYSVEDADTRYAVTVIDYTSADELHAANCRTLTYECDGREASSDIRGAIAWEAWNMRRRGSGEITYDAFGTVDGIPGHQLQIAHPDGSLSFIGLYMHARRLYVLEGTAPGHYPPPALFQQSLGILDGDGRRVRFEWDADGNRTRIDVSYEWVGVEDPVTGEPQ